MGYPLFWQLMEVGDPRVSHSGRVLWLVGLPGEGHGSSPGSEFTAASAAAVNQSSSSPSRKGRQDLQIYRLGQFKLNLACCIGINEVLLFENLLIITIIINRHHPPGQTKTSVVCLAVRFTLTEAGEVTSV